VLHVMGVRRPKAQSLEGLRVLCCLMIVLGHLDVLDPHLAGISKTSLGRGLLGDSPQARALKGITRTAVECFFAISGYAFALPHVLGGFSRQKAAIDLIKRFPRLILPLIPVHLLVLILWSTESAWFNYHSIPPSEQIKAAYTQNGLISLFFSSILNGPIWVVEWFAYVPFIVALHALVTETLSFRSRFLFSCSGLIYFGLHPTQMHFFGSVFAGSFLAYWFNSFDTESLRNRFSLLPMILSVVLIPLAWIPVPLYFVSDFAFKVSGCSIVALSHSSFPKSVLERLGSLSRFTYAVYIYHHPIFGFTGKSLEPHLEGAGGRWALYPLGFLFVIATSYVSVITIERWSEKVINLLIGTLKSQEPAPFLGTLETIASASSSSPTSDLEKPQHTTLKTA